MSREIAIQRFLEDGLSWDPAAVPMEDRFTVRLTIFCRMTANNSEAMRNVW